MSGYRTADGVLHRPTDIFLGIMQDTGEKVYGYFDNAGKLHTNIVTESNGKQMIYYCEHCNQEYIADGDFKGFIPKCINCGAIMKRRDK